MPRNNARATEARDAQALALAAKGLTTVEIAAELGYATHSGAVKAVRRALDRKQPADAEEYRELHLAEGRAIRKKLYAIMDDEKQRGQWPRTAEVLIKLMEREAKLLGIDIIEPTIQLTAEQLTIVVANVNVEAI